MTELTQRHVYIACPIDDSGGLLDGIRGAIRWELQQANVNFYDPAGGWCTPQPFCSSHMSVNDLVIRMSLGMIAILPAGICGIGTPMEIRQAHELGLPVVVVTNVQSRQLASMGIPMFSIEEYGLAVGALIQQIKTWEYRSPTVTDLMFTTQDPRIQLARAYPGDAGFDLTVTGGRHVLSPGEFKDIPTGIAVQMPEGTWGAIIGRSSAIRKRGLHIHYSVIDGGFRGELFAAAQNVSIKTCIIEEGERLAQFIVMPNASESVRPLMVEQLDPSERGEKGFGSTGR